MSAPRYIAICGYPNSGKSTVQKILETEYGVIPVDDGRILRDFAKRMFGMCESDVNTQAGKEKYTSIGDKTWQNRNVLGTLGQILEDTFGEQVIPETAMRDADHMTGACFSFGSVRKAQAWDYKKRGGFVISVLRDTCYPEYDFDYYDFEAVDIAIDNNGSLEDLHDAVHAICADLGLQKITTIQSKKEHFDVV